MSELSSTQYIKKLVAVKFLRSIGYDIITKQEHDILIMVRMNNQQLTASRDAWKADAERLEVSLVDLLSLIEEHGAEHIRGHAKQLMKIRHPITPHQLLIEEEK